MRSRISIRGCVRPSVCRSHTSWFSEKWAEFEQNCSRNIELAHFKDNSETSTRADRQTASDIWALSLSDLVFASLLTIFRFPYVCPLCLSYLNFPHLLSFASLVLLVANREILVEMQPASGRPCSTMVHDFETSNHSLSHVLRSQWVSKWANKWVSEWVSKPTNERSRAYKRSKQGGASK